MAGPSFTRATYLGGAPNVPKKKTGILYFNDDVIGIGTFKPKAFTLKTDVIASIEVGGGQVAKSKVGAELAFGVLGGLGAKGAANQTQLAVRTKGGMTCFFQIDRVSAAEVRAKLAPWMQSRGIAFYEDAQHAEMVQAMAAGAHSADPSPASKADELAKLAALRDQGVLTEVEFQEQKAMLLRSS